MGLPGKAHRNVGTCASVCMRLSVTICRSVNMHADICTLYVSISVYPYSHALCILYVHVYMNSVYDCVCGCCFAYMSVCECAHSCVSRQADTCVGCVSTCVCSCIELFSHSFCGCIALEGRVWGSIVSVPTPGLLK